MSDSGKAVFLSYASQDAEAARRICDALRSAGVEVWFDQSELVGGDAWDQKIRRQIKECALFVPIISANTQARHEGYFRREWKLAVERTHDMADHVAFLLPVVIDATTDAEAFVPEKFREVQWTRLRGGDMPPAFAARVQALLAGGPAPSSPRPAKAIAHGGNRTPVHSHRRWTPALFLAAGAVVVGALAVVWFAKNQFTSSAHPAANVAPVSLTAAQKLVAEAQRVYESGDELNRENLSLADDLVQQALKLDPAEPTAWELAARLSYVMVWQGIDNSDERREAMQRQAARAVALAPNSVDAQVVALNARMAGISWVASGNDQQQGLRDVQRELTTLAAREPRNWQVQRALGMADRFLDRPEDSISALRRAVELSGGDPSVTVDLVNVLERRKQLNEAEAVVAAGLARKPNARLLAEDVFFKTRWRGDLAGAEGAIASWPGWLLQDDRGLFLAWQTFYWKREPDKALGFANRFPRDYLHDAWFEGPRAVLTARAHEMAGDAAAAQADWHSVVQVVAHDLARRPEDPSALYWKAWALARLGQTEEARALCRVLLQRGRSNRSVFLKGTNLAPLLIMAGMTEDALADVQTQLTTFNDSNTLTRAVLELDPAFDSIRNDPRFRQLVESAPAPAAAPNAAARATASAPDPKSVVVLPFANLSGDPAQEYFSDGLTEEILNALARERDLRVVPRTSAFSFKGKNLPLPEIARALNVAQVVEGSVRRAGNTVRIDCTLTRVSDGFAQPLPQFQREMKDASGIFALEDEVARAVVQKLTQRGTMTATDGGTSNWEAYDRFLRARTLQFSHATGPSGYKAMREYEEVVRLDPRFGLAWAQLAEVAAGLGTADGGFDMSEATRARAVEAANQAVRLAPNLPDAHVARAVVCLLIEQNSDEAARELHEADRLQPFNAGLARVRATVEAPTASNARLLELVTRAVELDPQNTNTLTAMGQLLWRRGDFAHADEFLHRATVIGESQNAFLTRGLNWAAWTGDIRQALAVVNGCPEPFRNELFYRIVAPLYEEEGDEAEAVATWEKAREMAEKEIQTPGIRSAHVLILVELGRHAALANNLGRAKVYFDQARRELDALLQEQPHTFNIQMRQVQWLAAQAKFSEALAALEKIESSAPAAKFHAPGNLTGIAEGVAAETKARLLAALGKTDAAIDQLHRMQAGGSAFGYALRLTPEFKSLRDVPALASLMRDAEARADAMPPPKE